MSENIMRKEDYEKMRDEILAAKTATEVLEAFHRCYYENDGSNYDSQYETCIKWIYERAIALVATISDAIKILDDYGFYSKSEGHLALDKALELCKIKGDVEEILSFVCGADFVGLGEEEWFLRIFARGHELPAWPEEEK